MRIKRTGLTTDTPTVFDLLEGAGKSPISALRRTALHGAALFTQAGELHSRIEKLENELEADLLVIEHEAKLVKGKFL